MVGIFIRISIFFRAITKKQILKPVCSGICLVLSLPPWGFWPLAFIAFAMLDQILKETNGPASRFFTGFGFAVGWLFPGTFWMIALTVPFHLSNSKEYAPFNCSSCSVHIN
jgi:apolipoprotein N-acyltransferase